MAVTQAQTEVGLAGKPSIGGAQVIAVFCVQAAVALHDVLRVQVVEVGVEIVYTGACQPLAVLQPQRLGLGELQVDPHRRHHVGVVARVVALCAYGPCQILDVLIGIFVAQARHHRDGLSAVGIAEITAHDVIAVFVVVAPQVVVSPLPRHGPAVIEVVLALVVAQDVLGAHFQRVLPPQRCAIVQLQGVFVGLVVTVGAVVIELELFYQARHAATHDVGILGDVLAVRRTGTQLIRQRGDTLVVAPSVALVVQIKGAVEHRVLQIAMAQIRVVCLTVALAPHAGTLVAHHVLLGTHTHQREGDHLHAVYLVAGVDRGKLGVVLRFGAVHAPELGGATRAVAIAQQRRPVLRRQYAVVREVGVKGKPSYLAHRHHAAVVGRRTCTGPQGGKMALILRAHHDVDNAAYALGIIPGTRRGDDFNALDHLGRQTAQHLLGVARDGGLATVLQDEKLLGAVHLYIAVAVYAYQWHLAHHLRESQYLGVGVRRHIVGQLVHIHRHQRFLCIHRYLFQHLHIIGDIDGPYVHDFLSLRQSEATGLCHSAHHGCGDGVLAGHDGHHHLKSANAIGQHLLHAGARQRLVCHAYGSHHLGLASLLVHHRSRNLARRGSGGRLGAHRHRKHDSQYFQHH